MEVFLELHGYALDIADEVLASWILELAEGLDARGLAEKIRLVIHPRP